MLQKSEADLLRPYFEDVLKRAMATYQVKYNTSSRGRFKSKSIRTTRILPCGRRECPVWARRRHFRTAVAMDSPSARKPGDFNWASTLWHEMSHI